MPWAQRALALQAQRAYKRTVVDWQANRRMWAALAGRVLRDLEQFVVSGPSASRAG